MSGQQEPIWHVKVRRFGQADFEIAEIRMNGRRKPKKDEIINVGITTVVGSRENIVAKVVSFSETTSGPRTRFVVHAAEQDNGNPPGHREATERDFQR
jgi:hypothetical protein